MCRSIWSAKRLRTRLRMNPTWLSAETWRRASIPVTIELVTGPRLGPIREAAFTPIFAKRMTWSLGRSRRSGCIGHLERGTRPGQLIARDRKG